jgi:hypothetical protein
MFVERFFGANLVIATVHSARSVHSLPGDVAQFDVCHSTLTDRQKLIKWQSSVDTSGMTATVSDGNNSGSYR